MRTPRYLAPRNRLRVWQLVALGLVALGVSTATTTVLLWWVYKLVASGACS